MTFWRVLGCLAVLPVLLVGLGVITVLGAGFYEDSIFFKQRPEKALRAFFLNPEEAQVLESEQHGAFKFGDVIHTAQGTVRGASLQLQPYMTPMTGKNPRRLFGGWETCDQLLRDKNENLKFYGVSSKTGPSNLDSYIVEQPATHTFCFIHVEF